MLNLRYHLFLVSLLPFIAIHLSLILSIQNDFLDFCYPYVDGCYSISRAARQPYSIIIFKILMITSAGFLFFLWQRIFNKEKNKSPILIGKIGSLFLVIYVIALGNDGFIYEFMRRIGVFIFFIFTLTSQWIFTFSQSIKRTKFSININLLKFTSFSQILLFILATPFFLIIKNDGFIENIFEWWITLFITIWFFVNFLYYKKND